ncbi:hypothetical protein B5S31_g5172 [[Candida] boidinii]|nr:hypothetical protein B5S31_g5172 [[Candida] boidinii]
MLNNDTTATEIPTTDIPIPVKKKRGRKPGSTKLAISKSATTVSTVSKTAKPKTIRTSKPKFANTTNSKKIIKSSTITNKIDLISNSNSDSNDRDIDTVMAAKMLDQLRNGNSNNNNTNNSTTLLDKFASHPIISNSINYIFEKTLSTSANYLHEDSSNSTIKENDSIDPLSKSSPNNITSITKKKNELNFQNLNSNTTINTSSSSSPSILPLPPLNNTSSKIIEPSTLSSSISSSSLSLSTPSSSSSPSSNQIDIRSSSPIQPQSQTQLPPLRNVLSNLPLNKDTNNIINNDNFTTATNNNSRSNSISPTLPNIEIKKRPIEDAINYPSRNKLIKLNNQDNNEQQQNSFDQIQLQQQLTTKLNYLSYLKKPNNNSNLLRHQANLSSYASTQRTLQDLKDLNMINFSIESRKKLTMLINFLKLGNRQLSDRIENLIHSVENERNKNLKIVKNSDSSDSDKDESNNNSPSSSSSYSSLLNKFKENESSANSSSSTQELKDDIIITVKKIVNVVSKVSANSLPEPARSRVREALLKLPSNWAFAIKESNDIVSHNVSRTKNSENGNDDTIDSDSDLDSDDDDDDNSDNSSDSEDSDSDDNSDNDKFEDSKEYLSCPPSPKQKRTPNPNNNQFTDTVSPLTTAATTTTTNFITTSNSSNNNPYPSTPLSINNSKQLNNNNTTTTTNNNIRKRKSISEQLLSNLIKYSSMSKKRREEKRKKKLELSRIDTIVVQSNSNSTSNSNSINNSGSGIIKKKHKKRNWLRHTIKKQLLYDPNGKILIVAQESLDMINKVIKFCNDSLDKAETWNLNKQNQQTHQLVNKLETINKYLIPNETNGNTNTTNSPNVTSPSSNLNPTTTTTTTTNTTIPNNNNPSTNSQTLKKDFNTDKTVIEK